MNTPLTEDERQEYEEQLDQLTEKDLLLQILVELQTIRYYMQPQQEESSNYRCKQCNEIVPEDGRSKHLQDSHGAPAELPVESEFERVK